MQFGTLTWGLLLCFLSFQHGILTWLQHSIAVCSCFFSISFGRGQGSAAGAAEDHMTCMLDALKCMGLVDCVAEDVHHLFCDSLYVRRLFARNMLRAQFGTLTWILDVFGFISELHFHMVAASHCSCCSQCVGRGRGSAAGAAEDHMTCKLDALKSWDYTHDGCTVSNMELLETCLEQRSCI